MTVLELPFTRSNVIEVPDERWKQKRSEPSRRERRNVEQVHPSFDQIRPWDDGDGAA